MARTRVVLRRNGSKVGEVTYASESEAVAHAAKMQGAASGLEALLAPATGAKSNPTPKRSLVAQVVGIVKGANVPYAARGQAGNAVSVRGSRSGGVLVESHAPNAVALVGAVERAAVAAGWSVSYRHAGGALGYDQRDGAAIILQSPLVPNPSAELRHNPTPIDVASLDFADFKRTTVIKGYYNVRTGRRFARVASRDGTFITDVPVKDGTPGESGTRGADAVKKRAYEQLRIHIQPTKWKPSVRVNPGNAGSVRYGNTAIRIADGSYTVQPHGPVFNGPNGFVAAKKWIDTNGA